jgi:hypothetical protein
VVLKGTSPQENDAIVLLSYFAENPGPHKMTHLSRKLGIPLMRLYRLTSPKLEVWHTEEALLAMREKAPRRYWRILENLTRVADGKYYTNVSLFHVLVGTGLHMGLSVRFVGKPGQRIVVQRISLPLIYTLQNSADENLDEDSFT